MPDDELRKLRHDIRGRLHNLGMCIAALSTPMDREDRLAFVNDIIAICDQIPPLVERLLTMFPDESV